MDGDTAEGMTDPALWDRIAKATLPAGLLAPTASLQSKPEAFNDFPELDSMTGEDAFRLGEEYRRFLYLRAVHGDAIAASPWLERVAARHLRLETFDPRSFAASDLPEDCLPRLPPVPSGKTPARPRTHALYRQEFGALPPGDIWPGQKEERTLQRGRQILALGLAMFFLGLAGLLTSQLLRGVVLYGPFAGLSTILFFAGIAIAIHGSNLKKSAEFAPTTD